MVELFRLVNCCNLPRILVSTDWTGDKSTIEIRPTCLFDHQNNRTDAHTYVFFSQKKHISLWYDAIKELCQEDEALLGDKMKCYVNQKWYSLLFMLAIYQDMQHRNKYHSIVWVWRNLSKLHSISFWYSLTPYNTVFNTYQKAHPHKDPDSRTGPPGSAVFK